MVSATRRRSCANVMKATLVSGAKHLYAQKIALAMVNAQRMGVLALRVGQVHSVTSERAQIIAMVLENVSMGHVSVMNTTKAFRAKSENAKMIATSVVSATLLLLCAAVHLAGKAKAASDRLVATAVANMDTAQWMIAGLVHIVNVKLVTPVVIANTRAKTNATVMGVVEQMLMGNQNASSVMQATVGFTVKNDVQTAAVEKASAWLLENAHASLVGLVRVVM